MGGHEDASMTELTPLEERLERDEFEARADLLRKEVEAEIRRRLVADRGAEAMAKTLRKPLPEDIVKQLKLTLTKDRYKTEKGQVLLFDGVYKIDPGQRPKHIDITAPEGEQAGKTSKGIYALEGETLRMCYADKDRPKDFESKPGSGATLVVWKRSK